MRREWNLGDLDWTLIGWRQNDWELGMTFARLEAGRPDVAPVPAAVPGSVRGALVAPESSPRPSRRSIREPPSGSRTGTGRSRARCPSCPRSNRATASCSSPTASTTRAPYLSTKRRSRPSVGRSKPSRSISPTPSRPAARTSRSSSPTCPPTSARSAARAASATGRLATTTAGTGRRGSCRSVSPGAIRLELRRGARLVDAAVRTDLDLATGIGSPAGSRQRRGCRGCRRRRDRSRREPYRASSRGFGRVVGDGRSRRRRTVAPPRRTCSRSTG